MDGSAVSTYDPSRITRGREHGSGAAEVPRGPTRIEEATQIASHGVDRVLELHIDARDALDSRLGPRPPQATGTNGNKEPSIAGSTNELHQQLRRLHGAIDQLTAELQRLREL